MYLIKDNSNCLCIYYNRLLLLPINLEQSKKCLNIVGLAYTVKSVSIKDRQEIQKKKIALEVIIKMTFIHML